MHEIMVHPETPAGAAANEAVTMAVALPVGAGVPSARVTFLLAFKATG